VRWRGRGVWKGSRRLAIGGRGEGGLVLGFLV